MRKPNLFIVGFPKAGTTSLAYWLSQHPDVFLSKIKEFHFFSKEDIGILNFSEEEYLSYFKNRKEKYLLDASTSYIYSKVSPKKILDFNPDSKFILMLRNPVDLVYSLHEQRLYEGIEMVENFEKAWNLSDLRWEGKDISSYKAPKSLAYKQIGKIATHTKNFLKYVPKDKVLIIFFEELKNPDTLWYKILNFLEIPYIQISFEKKNPAKVVKYKKLNKFLFNLYKIKTNLGINKQFGIINKIREKFTIYRQREPLNEDLKLEILNYYLPEIEELESILKVDLTHWKK